MRRNLSFAEVILRVGSTFVSWLLIYGHGLTLAVIPVADCSLEDDSLWRGTLVLGVLAMVGAALLTGSLPWRSMMRWFVLPALPLWVYGVYVTWGFLEPVSLSSQPLCGVQQGHVSELVAPTWQRLWAPTQLAAIALGMLQSLRFWRAG